MLAAREAAVASPGGRHETITLQTETTTPRARTLSASFVRERTPPGELPPARRQRMKNEGKARARAVVRLDPVGHERYLEAERTRKKAAALRAARGAQQPYVQQQPQQPYAQQPQQPYAHAGPPSPPWKQQARERVTAELQALEQRRDERVARGQRSRERRAAFHSSARCGLCASCCVLIRFGGSLKKGRGLCEKALLEFPEGW